MAARWTATAAAAGRPLLGRHGANILVRYAATSTTAATQRRPVVVGIRREDKNRWERRVPLTPTHVRRLVDDGIGVLVQSSARRVVPDIEFAQA